MQQNHPLIVHTEQHPRDTVSAEVRTHLPHPISEVPAGRHAKRPAVLNRLDVHAYLSTVGFRQVEEPIAHRLVARPFLREEVRRYISQRTAIINQIRGLAREYGVNFAKSREALLEQLPAALADPDNAARSS